MIEGFAMRDPIENVSLLQKQLNELQLENQILKIFLTAPAFPMHLS